MNRVLTATVVATLTIMITGGVAFADPPLPLPRIPISGDQDGSEAPLVLNAPGFDLLTDVQTFRVPGTGPVDITFDFVFREATFDNEFGFFPVESIAGQVDGLNPGDPGYLAAALNQALIVFPSGSTAFTPDVTRSMNGGDILAFFIIQDSTLASFLANNPTNDLNGSPLAFFSIDALDPNGFDHFVGFRNLTDDITQFAFEDLTGGGDQDYDDIVYNVKVVLQPSPPVKQRDIVFVKGLGSVGNCGGANEWARDYLSSEQGKSFFGNVEVGKYLNFNYADGGSYDCSESPPDAYARADTCDGVANAAGELKELINEEATAKATIVAHSMGGLVAAYLVASEEAWAKSHIASVITFDSPLKGLPEFVIKRSAFFFDCESTDPSIQELIDTSYVVNDAAPAATIVPLYPLDATKLLDPVDFVIARNRTRLDSARPFLVGNWCGFPGAPSEPDCEPPRSANDDHSQNWSRRLDGDGQDKAFLVGCAVVGAFDCTFLTTPTAQGVTTQTRVEINASSTRVRFTSNFGSTVRMTLISPDGTVYGPDGAGPIAAYAVDDVSEVYEIIDPAPGTWTVELFGVDVAAEGEDVALALLILESSGPVFEAPPVADAGGPYTGGVREAITFNGIGSFDPDGTVDLYEWDFESDGAFDFSSTDPIAIHAYPTEFSGKATLRVTDNDGRTGTNLVAVTVQAPPVELCSITGKVFLQGRSNHSGDTIRIDGTSFATTDSDGRFTVEDLDTGVYIVTASHLGYLSSKDNSVPCPAGQATQMPETTLLGGDTNNDKDINLFDLAKVGAAYGSCTGDGWFRPEADINETGCVDILDLVLVGTNYGRTGPTGWPTQLTNASAPPAFTGEPNYQPDLERLFMRRLVNVEWWNLQVNDVSNLYGIDVAIGFDPTLVKVVDADPDRAGVQILPGPLFAERKYFIAKNLVTVDEKAGVGTIRFAATLLNPSEPIDAGGVVATIPVRLIGKPDLRAPVNLSIRDALLANKGGRPLLIKREGSTIRHPSSSRPRLSVVAQ